MKQTDEDIQQAVLRELAWDTRVPSTHIGVMIDGGVVTLTGEVATLGARLAAQEAAHRVLGVRDVANNLVVCPTGSQIRPDTLLAQAVRHALEWDATVPAARIQTSVSDGWVTLAGQVDHWHQREEAERAVRHLAGVRGVTNQLAVVQGVVAAAAAIRHEIEAALERRAARSAQQVTLTVEAGRVTVSGQVRSLADKQAILSAARGTSGVHQVIDQLQVELVDA